MKTNHISTGLHLAMEAARTNPEKAYEAAMMLENENRSLSAAQYFYSLSARNGYAPAMLKMAAYCMSGTYIMEDSDGYKAFAKPDPKQAVFWIKRARSCDIHDPSAAYLLARCYVEGIAVCRDHGMATNLLCEVPFPLAAFNPYEPYEAYVFGSVSSKMKSFVYDFRNRRPLDAAV